MERLQMIHVYMLFNMENKFNVLFWNFNKQTVEPYDVIPYFVRMWQDYKGDKSEFKTFNDFKKFVDNEAQYNFWGRCEYEFIIEGWPVKGKEIKIDIYEQLKMNLDLVTTIFMNSINVSLNEDKN